MKIKAAFTLIELLVVIAIIGILSGLIVITMNGVTDKASMAKAQVFSNSLRNSLLMNLVSEWKMDDGSGQSITDGWNGINGTLGSTTSADTNDPTWTTSDCVYGNCLSFDGTDDYVAIANDSRLNMYEGSITVSVWVKFRAFASPSWAEIFYGGATGGNNGYGFMISTTGSLRHEICGSTNGRQYFTTNAGLALNKWYNIVMTFDSSNNNLKLYKDGSAVSDQTISDPGSVASSTGAFKIGAYGTGTQYYLNGYVDEIRVFNAAIPTSQIKEQYYAGLNKLLAGGGISEGEYAERISALALGD
jgi:prepilin-type N-terminal cleavage/methylation domain-containing protein